MNHHSTREKRKRSAHYTLYLPLEQQVDTEEKKPRVIVLCGPTATGKTALSLELAKAIGGEIISADSMQVYRGMDIGTAKASREERAAVAHHLIDVCDLNRPFNIVKFYNLAHKACRDIIAKGKVPIIVGGTGFYVHSFLYGPPTGPASEKKVRNNLEKQMEQMGPEVLYERLQILDPEYAKTITERDKNKIIRALEIICISKKKVSDFRLKHEDKGYDFRSWFIYYPKETLYPRIDKRCDEMIEKGLIEEVCSLKEKGLLENQSAALAIGYRQCLDFLKTSQSQVEREAFISLFKQASRHLAKRQFTWFRKEPLFRWMNLEEMNFDEVKEHILQDYEIG